MDFLQFKRVFQLTGAIESRVQKKRQNGDGETLAVNVMGAGWREYCSLTPDLFRDLPPDGSIVQLTGEMAGDGKDRYLKVKTLKVLGQAEPSQQRRAA